MASISEDRWAEMKRIAAQDPSVRFPVIITLKEGAGLEPLKRAGLQIAHHSFSIVSGSASLSELRKLSSLSEVELLEEDRVVGGVHDHAHVPEALRGRATADRAGQGICARMPDVPAEEPLACGVASHEALAGRAEALWLEIDGCVCALTHGVAFSSLVPPAQRKGHPKVAFSGRSPGSPAG